MTFVETIFRHNEGRFNEIRQSHEGAVAPHTQVLQTSFATTRSPTFEVDTMLRNRLSSRRGHYEDFAFKLEAHVAQQDAGFVDELEKLEKLDAPPVLKFGGN